MLTIPTSIECFIQAEGKSDRIPFLSSLILLFIVNSTAFSVVILAAPIRAKDKYLTGKWSQADLTAYYFQRLSIGRYLLPFRANRRRRKCTWFFNMKAKKFAVVCELMVWLTLVPQCGMYHIPWPHTFPFNLSVKLEIFVSRWGIL